MSIATLPAGQAVTFKAAGRQTNAQTRTGKVIEVIESQRGLWVTVEEDETGKVFKTRPALVQAA